ncbi:MAG: RNA polymerase sigma factor, partial [Nocardioides sp.]
MRTDKAQIDHLVAAASAGDAAALDELLTIMRPEMLRYCRRMLPFGDDAEDACQDALLRISQHIGRFRGQSRFRTWVYQVCANASRDSYRRLRLASEHSMNAVPDKVDPRTTSVIAGSRLDLLDALERMEQSHPVWIEAFLLRDVYGLSYADIAEHLDIPMGTVKQRIHNARSWIRSEL